MAPLHALQGQVVAGLQRQMEMRHQPLLLGDRRHQRGIGLDRVDRGEPRAAAAPARASAPWRTSLPSVISPGRSRAIGGDVDAGQHDLGIAVLDELAHLRHHLARRHRARRPAAEGNDAEGAAMVAAVLDLHIGARSGCRSRRSDGPRSRCTDMMSLTTTRSVSATAEALRRSGFGLLLIADDVVDLRPWRRKRPGSICAAQPVTTILASGRSRRALRIACRAWRTALRRHRAGVDDHRAVEPGGVRMLAHDLRFVGVEPAAEGDDLDIRHWRLLT